MSEENSNNAEWQVPPPLKNDEPISEPAQMSEVATLGNIFFEPGRTFEDLQRKPRFILALLITILLWTGYMIAFQNKVGDEAFKREFTRQNEKNQSISQMSNEDKQKTVNMQLTFTKGVFYGFGIFIVIITVIGTLCYWAAARAMGSEIGFSQTLSVWLYSALPSTIFRLTQKIKSLS